MEEKNYNTYLYVPFGLAGNMRADMQSSVENELLCSQLPEHYGMHTAGSV